MSLEDFLEKYTLYGKLGFKDGGLVAPSTGLGGTLGGTIMSNVRPSSILGIGRGLSAFDPSSFPVTNLGMTYDGDNRATATPFRRDFLQETGLPSLDPEGQPYLTRAEIQDKINSAVKEAESRVLRQATSPRRVRGDLFSPGRYADGGLVEEDIISRLTTIPESFKPKEREKPPVPKGADTGLELLAKNVKKVMNPTFTSAINPFSDEERVKMKIRPNLPGSTQRVRLEFPFQEGGLVDSDPSTTGADLNEMNLSKEDEDLLRISMVALDEESDLSDEEREVILRESVSRFGEEFVMSLMSTLASSAQIGDGMSDSINARLSHGEYVIPADAVAHAGDGSTKVGGARLDEFVKDLRRFKTGTDKQAPALEMAGGGLAQYMYRDGGLVEKEEFELPPVPESLRGPAAKYNDMPDDSPLRLPGGGVITMEQLSRMPLSEEAVGLLRGEDRDEIREDEKRRTRKVYTFDF